jgi:IS30 family transposase
MFLNYLRNLVLLFASTVEVDVQRVENLLNNRPRKALNYHSPNEVFAKLTAPPENYALGM